MARGRLAAAVALAAVAAGWGAAAWALASPGPAVLARAGGLSLARVSSGLAFERSLAGVPAVRDLGDDFEFSGSASPQVGYQRVGPAGLTVGVRRHSGGFAGWFAVTRWALPAQGVYHVRMSKPPGQLSGPGAQGEAVFAVQTATTKLNGLINYVVVASRSAGGATSWLVGYAQGRLSHARLQVLYQTPASASAPSSREVSLATDGRRRLVVCFGRQVVYASDSLSMDIPAPYQAYLEVQSSGPPYQARFSDLWVTRGSAVGLAGLGPGQAALLATPGGQVVAAGRGGQARLELAPGLARGRGVLWVAQGARRWRLGPFSYWAGDRLRLG
jgi:hypothetical protein